jgi:hypothetical protein
LTETLLLQFAYRSIKWLPRSSGEFALFVADDVGVDRGRLYARMPHPALYDIERDATLNCANTKGVTRCFWHR